MSDDQSEPSTLRRRVLQSSSALLFSLAGCNSLSPDRQATSTATEEPTSTPTRTATPTTTPAGTDGVVSEQPEVRSVSSSEYLAGGAEADAEGVQAMIEDVAATGPSRLQWDTGTVTMEQTIAPETDGTEVVIEGSDEVVIDGTAVDGHILDLRSAPNVVLDRLTIEGSSGSEPGRSVIAGDGTTLRETVLAGGAGGLEIRGSDVTVEGFEAYGHRDTTNGYAAGIHASTEIENIRISDIDIHDCDRGVEIDDGPSGWTVERGRIRNIDNSQAEDPGVPFALDCHVHAGASPIEDGTFRDILVEDCRSGLSVSEHEEGLVTGIVAEDIRVKRVGAKEHVLCEADVELINPTVEAGADNDNWGILIRGGNVRIEGGHVSSPTGYALTTEEGSRTPLSEVQIDGLSING